MRLLLLLVAAVVAILAGVAALQLSGPPPAEKPQAQAQNGVAPDVATVDVLVARAGIPAGTQITPAMIDRQPWPENLVLEGFIVGTTPEAANVVGKITRAPLQPREPLLVSKLAGKDDAGFLAATLPAGMRAITIGTDAITGVAGFVYPGDRVDIVFTHSIPEKGAGGNRPPAAGLAALGMAGSSASVAEVLAANVPVLAVNIRSNDAGSGFSPAAGLLGSATEAIGAATGVAGGGSSSPSSLTLQVTDIQAEKIRLAERVGNISVALRSVQDRADAMLPPPTGLSSLTQMQGAVAIQNVSPDEVRVVRGGMHAMPAAPAAANPLTGMFNMFEQR